MRRFTDVLLEARVITTFVHTPTGAVVGTGMGSCELTCIGTHVSDGGTQSRLGEHQGRALTSVLAAVSLT